MADGTRQTADGIVNDLQGGGGRIEGFEGPLVAVREDCVVNLNSVISE
jgi:hypothetical protein